jgi:hypothetical protein
MESDIIVFHHDALFGEYRAEPALLRPAPTCGGVEKRRRFNTEEDDEPPPQSPTREPPRVEERDDTVMDAALQRQQSAVYSLFRYLGDETVARLTPRFDDLVALLQDRCRPFVREVRAQEAHIRALWRTLVQRLLLEMLAEDASGLKIREVRLALEEPYLAVRGARSNLAHLDLVRELTCETARESLDFEQDAFYRKCAGPKRRGRRPGSEKRVELNALQLVKQHYITAKKAGGSGETKSSGGAPIDLYPLFAKVLAVVAGCIPQPENHGWYLAVLDQAVRALSSAQWPARGLVRALLNAERVLERRRVTVERGESSDEAPLYCAYSGARLVDGDECWLLRLVLNSGVRHRQWNKKGHLPAVPHHDPLFARAVRAYLVKCRVTCVCSVFYAPANESEQPPPPLPLVRSGGLPPNRQFCVNTLWLLMNQLRNFVHASGLQPHVWLTRHVGATERVSYARESAALVHMMDTLQQNELSFQRDFRTLLIVGCFGPAFVQRLCDGELPPEQAAGVRRYAEWVREAVLDFCDLQFHFTAAPLTREVVAFAQFNLPLLGVSMDESEQSRKRFVAQHGKVAAPKLRDAAQNLLAQLLWASSKRAAERQARPTHDEQRQLMDRLQRCVQQHPFLFMVLFDYLFQPAAQSNTTQARLSGFPDNLTLLNRLRLSINTEEDAVQL